LANAQSGLLSAQAVTSGIIGTGFIGQVHARAVVAAGGHLAGVADATEALAQAGASRLRAERAFPDAEALIKDPAIEVVHICTPNHLHVPLARAALAAGKHVICEKPLATDERDAAELEALAEAAGVVAAVPFAYRYYASVREARDRIARGATGDLRVLHGSYSQDWLSTPKDNNWRVDSALGGTSRAFADIGVHWCDLMEFTTGQRIVELVARTLTVMSERGDATSSAKVGTEDAVALTFHTDAGAIGSLMLSQVSPGRKNRLWFSFDGADETLEFNQESPETLWIGGRASNTILTRGAEGSSTEALRYSVLPAGHPQGYQDCFNAFVLEVYQAVRGEVRDGLPRFSDGRRAAALTQCVLTSAATRSWVEVPR